MKDTLTLEEEKQTPTNDRRGRRILPSFKWQTILAIFGFLFGIGLGMRVLLSWVHTRGVTELTCHVGTAKYDSFDSWGGRLDIQEDKGNCTSQWKCRVSFSFSNEGSVLMSRGCLSKEVDFTKAGLLWIAKMNHMDKLNLDCFMMKVDDSTLSCVTNSPLLKAGEKMKIPSLLVEAFRNTLCDSPKAQPRWWTRFLSVITRSSSSPSSSGLFCPSSRQGTHLSLPGSGKWDAWWADFDREMGNLGFAGWNWRWKSSFASYKSFVQTPNFEEETVINRNNGTKERTVRIRLRPDQEVLRSDLPDGRGIHVRIIGPVDKNISPWIYKVFVIIQFHVPPGVPVEAIQMTQVDQEEVVIRLSRQIKWSFFK